MYYKLVEPDDVIILCSDGVHDNFDPQVLQKKEILLIFWFTIFFSSVLND